MSLQHPRDGKPSFFGPALVGACTGVIRSVPVAAYTAAALGSTYEARALVYTCFLLWVVVGAITIFVKTYKAPQQPLSVKMILIWCISLWLWPLLFIPAKKVKSARKD